MPYKVIQWTTGNVGQEMLQAIHQHPDLELVGLYAFGKDKQGRDAGELCGLPKLGINATGDIDALLALDADCVNYNPLWPNIDHLCRILDSGINVVTTAAFITGHGMGEEAIQRIEQACQRGQSSIYGSGMNPGFANLLALISTAGCSRVDRVRVLESVDASGYGSAETQRSVGFGHPADHPELHNMVEAGTAVFKDGLYLMADALGVELGSTHCESEFAVATEDTDLGFMTIDKGCIAGVAASWHGVVGGSSLIELRVQWIMGRHMEPEWKLQHGYVVDIEGMPNIHSKLQIMPPKDFVAHSAQDFMRLGMVATGMPVVNAIASVCEAAPGIRTAADLPLRAACASGRRQAG